MDKEITINGNTYVLKEEVKDNEIIEIPENIKLSINGDLIFNDDRNVVLYKHNFYDVYSYRSKYKNHNKNFKLVKIDKKDIKAGDLCFVTDYNNLPYVTNFDLWKLILKDEAEKYCFIDNESIYVHSVTWDNYYKVVLRNE